MTSEKIYQLIRFAEKALLILVVILTLVATAEEMVTIFQNKRVNLADLLLLFIYAEVLGMIGVFFISSRIPITLPLFIAITAISRLIILQGKEMDALTLIYEAAAILIISLACLAVRYKPKNQYQYQLDRDR